MARAAAATNNRPGSDHGGRRRHDVYTFVIEDALGIEYGFWGCVAAGATFKTLGRKRTPQGRATISSHLRELDDAETRVNEIYFGWRGGRPTSLDSELDSMLLRWQSLADGEELVLTWPTQGSAAVRRPQPVARDRRRRHA